MVDELVIYRMACFGCKEAYSSLDEPTVLLRMGSHTYGCKGARDMMRTAFTTETQSWKFNEYTWMFKYTPGDRSIYIFVNKTSNYAMCAIPLPFDAEPTLEAAQAASREWITAHNNGYSFDYVTSPKQHRFVYEEPAREPVAPAGYTGPVCDRCGKVDDGDLVPSPKDPQLHRCMICFVGGAGQ